MSIDQIFDLCGQIFLYLTIALIVIGGFVFIVFYKKKTADFKKVKLAYIIAIFIYAMVVATTMLALKFSSIKADDSIDFESYKYLLWPLVSMLIVMFISAISILICVKVNKDKIKLVVSIDSLLILGSFIAIMVCMSKYFELVADWYPNTNLVGLIVSVIVVAALIAIMYFVGNKTNGLDTKSIVYGAISIALSFALSYIRFFKMPQGGSITFASLLPLLIYCCMFGTRKGIIICLIYGTLQAVQDPWIIHPLQFLLDYPLAFGVIGISGIFIEKNAFKNKKLVGFILGAIIGVTLRFACHVVSGVFAFADYADLAKYSTTLIYSMAYNSNVFIDMLITIFCGSMLFSSSSFVSQMEKSTVTKTNDDIVLNDEDDEIDKLIISKQEEKDDSNK